MSKQVRFRVVKEHPLDEPLTIADDERVSRVEWNGRGYVNVIIIKGG